MSLGIYIAGAWVEQYTRARPMMAAVCQMGLTVTYDWTVPEGDVCACGDHVTLHAPPPSEGARPGICKACGCGGFNGVGQGSDADLPREYRIEHSGLELDAVYRSSILWHLAPNAQGSSGSWVELGAALMLRRVRVEATDGTSGTPYIIVSGPKNRRAIFTEQADILTATDEDALWHLRGVVERARKSISGASSTSR